MDGRVTSWNRAAERLYRYSAAEMVGRLYGEILDKEALEDFKQVFARVAAGERLSHHETARTRRDGTNFEVSMSLSPILAPNGSIVAEAAILHDITERRQRERDLAESRTLLEQAERVGHIGGWTSGVAPECTGDLDERGVPDIRGRRASQVDLGGLLREGPPRRSSSRPSGGDRGDRRGTSLRARISDRAPGRSATLGLLSGGYRH
jgi:PAS domain S-box-containing protein